MNHSEIKQYVHTQTKFSQMMLSMWELQKTRSWVCAFQRKNGSNTNGRVNHIKDFTQQRFISTYLILGGAPCSRSPQKPPQYIWGPLFPCGPPCRRWWFHQPRWRWRRCARSPRPSPGYRPHGQSYPHPLRGKKGKISKVGAWDNSFWLNLCVKFAETQQIVHFGEILWGIPGAQERGLTREHTRGVMAPHCGNKKTSAVLQNSPRILKSLPNTIHVGEQQIKFVFFKQGASGRMQDVWKWTWLGTGTCSDPKDNTTLGRICRFPTPQSLCTSPNGDSNICLTEELLIVCKILQSNSLEEPNSFISTSKKHNTSTGFWWQLYSWQNHGCDSSTKTWEQLRGGFKAPVPAPAQGAACRSAPP